jgi:hypothetical protein
LEYSVARELRNAGLTVGKTNTKQSTRQWQMHTWRHLARYVWQWYWDYDYLGNKYKAIYFGPRLDWMKLFTKRKKKKK